MITLPSSIALLFVLQFPLIRLSFDYVNMQLVVWNAMFITMAMDTGIQAWPIPPPTGLFDATSFLVCSLRWCVMMCTVFINSTSFSHWFYIIRTFRLALNQCWHSTRGTTGLIVRHNNIHLSPFKNLTLFRATIRHNRLRTHSHVTSH